MLSQKQNKHRIVLLSLFLLAICISLSSFSTLATRGQAATSNKHQPIDDQGRITILILSMANTMSTNDPTGIRCSAADAYIEQSRQNDQVGIIGLDNEAQIWQKPTPMNTGNAQQQAQQVIATRSNNCQADTVGSNPLYDALNQSLTMLEATTNEGALSGSVLLLTDTLPFPNSSSQMTDIKKNLVPRFQQNNWPINVVAFGSTTYSRDFLHHDLATATNGKFYDDFDEVTLASSPLLIESFFAQTYADFTGREVQPYLLATPLSGTKQYIFSPNQETDYLDIIVVKDRAGISATLTSPPPQNRTLPPEISGSSYVLTNNAYVTVFWVKQPQAGDWTLTITGNGTFLIDSMLSSLLKLEITSPSPTSHSVLPLGEPFPISATITKQGTFVGGLTVKATVTYAGSLPGKPSPQGFETFLNDTNSTGIYQGSISVPLNATRGSYTLTVTASDISGTLPIISPSSITILLEPEPTPLFLSQKTQKPTPNLVDYSFPNPDPFLQRLFGLPIGLSHWPFEHDLMQIPVIVPFEFVLPGKLSSASDVQQVTAQYTSIGSTTHPIAIKVGRVQGEHIPLLFNPDIAEGTYNVTFTVKSRLFDQPYTASRIIHISRPLSSSEWETWVLLLLYPISIILLILLFLWGQSRMVWHPFGLCWEQHLVNPEVYKYEFVEATYNKFIWFFGPHVLRSEQIQIHIENQPITMASGLKFRFRRKGVIEVRPRGKPGKQWKLGGGKKMRRGYQVTYELEHYSDNGIHEYTCTIFMDEKQLISVQSSSNPSISSGQPLRPDTVPNPAQTPLPTNPIPTPIPNTPLTSASSGQQEPTPPSSNGSSASTSLVMQEQIPPPNNVANPPQQAMEEQQ